MTASNGHGHGIHSPFVFEFITRILNDKSHYPEYEEVENIRKHLLNDKQVIRIDDLGAGSATTKSNERSLASITRTSVKPPKFGQLLFRMSRFYHAQHIIELGTSLGLTSAYLALGSTGAHLTTIEGSTAIADLAAQNFQKLQLQNVSLIRGNFDDELHPALNAMPRVDMAFIDGNHRKEPTIRYFESIISKAQNDTLIIVDDIHWSRDMEAAWAYCKKHSAVSLSIDLFFIGILVLRKEILQKQHFIVRF